MSMVEGSYVLSYYSVLVIIIMLLCMYGVNRNTVTTLGCVSFFLWM